MAELSDSSINPGTRASVHTSTFVRRTISTENQSGKSWKVVGYINPDGNRAVPQEYLVNITSIRNNCTIVCPLQEPIKKEVESRWEPFVPTSVLNNGNILIQAATGGRKSLITKATTRRVWQGSSPMTLSLSLKFNAIYDPVPEVVEPVRLLESIALPSEPNNGKGINMSLLGESISDADINKFGQFIDTIPLLSPPGPTPFTVEGILDLGEARNKSVEEIRKDMKGGDVIIIEVGRFLTFYNVIVTKVSSSTPIMMTREGDPISSTVDLVFETYEMITTEELSRMYTKNVLGG